MILVIANCLYLPILDSNKYIKASTSGFLIIKEIYTLEEIKEKHKGSTLYPLEEYEELEDYFLVKDRKKIR